jgi:hypothetical protein
MTHPEEKSKKIPREQLRQHSRCTTVTSWAVGRIEGGRLTALQFNAGVPFLLSAGEALKLSRALRTEAEMSSNPTQTKASESG